MTRPVSLIDRVRLHVYGPDTTTSRGTLSGDGASGTHSKDHDQSGLTLTVAAVEAILAADPTILENAFAVAERFKSGSWEAFGTPYLLSPGSGTTYGPQGQGDEEVSPVGVGALHGLASEIAVVPESPDKTAESFRYIGGVEGNRYDGWMSADYDETPDEWYDADVYDPAGQPKEKADRRWWGASAAGWVWHDPTGSTDDGGLTLCRFGSFTLATARRVFFSAGSDENSKLYLSGPNGGMCIIDFTGDEDGYNDEPGHWSRRLKAGTYFVAGEFRTVDSEGGDGNDSMKMSVYYFGGYDRTTPTELLTSGPDTRVHRQGVNEERPGFTDGAYLIRLLTDLDALGYDAATLLLANATFDATTDSTATAWSGGRERVAALGYPITSVIADMAEDCDADMGADFSFNLYEDRGTDLSASVAWTPGSSTPTALMNIEAGSYSSDAAGANSMLTLSQQGYDLREGTVPTGYRKTMGFLELGSAPSMGRSRKLADVAIRQGRKPRRYYTTQLAQVSGAVFYDNVNLCDRVSGRDYTKTAAVQEVTALNWSVSGDLARFTAETGEV